MTAPRVLITGAAGAIGGRTADLLRAAGAQVVGLDRHAGPGVLQADLCDAPGLAAAVRQAVAQLGGGLDVVINNAGIAEPQDSGLAPEAGALATLEVNLLGPWRVTAAALPFLLQGRGRVVNVASVAAFAPMPFAAAYCASKRGVAAFSDVLRLEYAPRLQVVTVYPGYIKTPIHAAAAKQGVSLEGLARLGSVEGAARTLVRAALGPVRRDLATSWGGALEMFFSRHFPSLVDAVLRRRIRKAFAAGRSASSVLAAGLRARMAEPGAGGGLQ